MSPRFKRKSKNLEDQWLDDENTRRHAKKNKISSEKIHAEYIDSEKANAVVIEVYPSLCRVKLDETPHGPFPLCQYRRKSVFHRGEHDSIRERAPVAVGDRVLVNVLSPQDGVVEGVAKRRNQITRLAPGREGQIAHTLAANVDRVVIVASSHQPEFSPGLVDRYLIAAQSYGIESVLCINKIDLSESRSNEAQDWEVYRKLGVRCFEVSALH